VINSLHKRVLSSIIGIPLVLMAVYYGSWFFLGLVTLVAILATMEYFLILNRHWGAHGKKFNFIRYAGYVGVFFILVTVFAKNGIEVFIVLVLLIMVYSVYFLLSFPKTNLIELCISFWGIIYIGGMSSFLILLREMEIGKTAVLLTLIGIWFYDTFAYFIGLKWGKRKMAPQLSPKKSVEGAVGGSCVVLLIAIPVALFYQLPLKGFSIIALALIVIIAAPLGDLYASALKRKLGVKDSGNLIPGHGGIIDRLDSILFTTPLVYVYLQLYH